MVSWNPSLHTDMTFNPMLVMRIQRIKQEHGCHFGETRTDYQMCLTNMPDDEGDLSRSSIMSSSVNQNEENLPSEGF